MKNTLGVLFCLMIAPAALLAQNSAGAIQGSVLDQTGAAISGASLTARNLNTGLTVKTTSSESGLYSFPNLPPGEYAVTAEAAGLKTTEQTGVNVQTSTTTALDISMSLGTASETVTVSASASPLQTNTSDIGSVVQQTLMENLPLEVAGTVRNPVQFITLVPGFVGKVGNNPGDNQTDDYKLNGGQEGGTDILVDGVSISLVSANIQQNKGISPDAIEEFKVLQSNFSAEYGSSGDSIINLSVKSGTNHLHGSAYEYLRNPVLDASSWKNNANGPNCGNKTPSFVCPKDIDRQNDFGFVVAGPVVIPHVYNGHDKTFFMGAYEGFRLQTGGNEVTSFPNEAFRKGDFSALLPGTQLYDPTTHVLIPGNILQNDPNFKPSAVMTKVFSFLPATNGALTNNVTAQTLARTTANIIDIKIDHTISDKQRVSGGFDWDNTKTGSIQSLGPIFGSSTPQNTRYARFSHDYIFTPSLLNHYLMGFSRRFRIEGSNSIGQGYPAKLGLTGVQNTTFPCIKFEDSSEYRERINNCGDDAFADNVFQFADSVSWVHGRHDFKFGGELRALQFNLRRLGGSAGQLHFRANETSLGGIGGNDIASALFGIVDNASVNFGRFAGVRYKNTGFYAQDNFKWSPRLTLNLGLRYDYDIPVTEAFNRLSIVDPALANPGAGNIPGAYTYFGTGPGRNGRRRPQDVYTKAFGPRLGFAYKLNDKTVLRGGYGIFYEPLKEPSFADQDNLGFFTSESTGIPFQIDNGVPQTQSPNAPLTPEGQNGQSGVVIAPRNTGRPGDIQSWNLDVQHQITSTLLLDVAYVGSKGSHLPALNILPNQVDPRFLPLGGDLTKNVSCLSDGSCPNAIAAGVKVPFPSFPTLWGGSATVAQALRPFPQYGNFVLDDNSFGYDKTGNSTYHAMQLRMNKRFAQGLNFLVSYTISKNLTDADSIGPGVSGFVGNGGFVGQNSYNRRAEKAVSQLDTPQNLVISFFYELPVGHNKSFLSHAGPLDRLVSGWYTSGILHYSSGIPTTVYGPCGGTAGDVLFGGCRDAGANARVNVIPGVKQTFTGSFNPNTTPFFNAAAFVGQAPPPAPPAFGNEPRALDHARDFAGKGEDFVLGKRTRLFGEKASIDFRAEFFNLFNRHVYNAPNGAFASPLNSPFHAAGTDIKDCGPAFACGFGAVTDASGPRIIQIGLKITY